MICPYCGEEMVCGKVPADRYELKFYPKNYSKIMSDKLIRSGLFGNHILLTKGKFFSGNLECFYCPHCKIIIAPIKQFDKK